MINLLPPELKQSITYARRNSQLARWIGLVMVSLAGVAVVVGFGLLYMNQSITTHRNENIATQQQLKNQKLEETQKRVTDISGSMKLVLQVLGKQILFSKLMQQIGAVTPSGAVLTDISINKVQGGIDLQADTTTYQAATQLQLNLQDPTNKIFNKADIVTIQCKGATTATNPLDARYPCTAIIRAQFATNNPFLFIPTGVKQ